MAVVTRSASRAAREAHPPLTMIGRERKTGTTVRFWLDPEVFETLDVPGTPSPPGLWATTMDPARRTLPRVTEPTAERADAILSLLMGESAADRRDWIEANAQYAANIDV